MEIKTAMYVKSKREKTIEYSWLEMYKLCKYSYKHL